MKAKKEKKRSLTVFYEDEAFVMSYSPRKVLAGEPKSLPVQPQASGEPSSRAMEIIRSLDRCVTVLGCVRLCEVHNEFVVIHLSEAA